MAYSTISKPSLHFNTKLYTGNSATLNVTGVGFQPDFTWLKSRTSSSYGHDLYDAVRGATKTLNSNANNAEYTEADRLQSFDSDGFTLGSAGATNSSTNYVSWNWKAVTSFTNDASATGIGTIDSSGSVNDAAGFSIVSFTGTGAAATIKHGLTTTPSCYIVKNRTASSNWFVYHKSTGATKSLFLDGTSAGIAATAYFNDTAPTSSVFSIGSETDISGSGQDLIAYCFAEVKGFSKFGSYTGNGGLDNNAPFIYTGFKPAWVMIKRTDTANSWIIFDNKRNPHNVVNTHMYADNTSPDDTSTNYNEIDFLSNGIKIREDNTTINPNGGTCIYMAFAEEPLVANVGASIPATAR